MCTDDRRALDPDLSPLEALYRWLCDNLSPEEFACTVRLRGGFGVGGDRLGASLPPANAIAPAIYFFRALELLRQHDALNLRFYAALVALRPLRSDELRRLQLGMRVPDAVTVAPVVRALRPERLTWALSLWTLTAAIAALGFNVATSLQTQVHETPAPVVVPVAPLSPAPVSEPRPPAPVSEPPGVAPAPGRPRPGKRRSRRVTPPQPGVVDDWQPEAMPPPVRPAKLRREDIQAGLEALMLDLREVHARAGDAEPFMRLVLYARPDGFPKILFDDRVFGEVREQTHALTAAANFGVAEAASDLYRCALDFARGVVDCIDYELR